MSEIPCAVVKDLLPLYVDQLTEKETNQFIKSHVEGCPECRKILNAMRTSEDFETVPAPSDTDLAEIDFLKKHRRILRLTAAFIPLIALLLLSGAAFYVKTLETKFDFQKFAAAAVRGDTFTFGTYEQDADLQNGSEDIVWIVLSNKNGHLTAISRYGLDAQPFNAAGSTDGWPDSDIRSWLNGAFYETAFSEEEKDLLSVTSVSNPQNPYYFTGGGDATQDTVYLLSEKEAEALSMDISIGFPTAAARAAGVSVDATGHCEWWLRTTGIREDTACRVGKSGYADAIGTKMDTEFIAVRPCISIRYN